MSTLRSRNQACGTALRACSLRRLGLDDQLADPARRGVHVQPLGVPADAVGAQAVDPGMGRPAALQRLPVRRALEARAGPVVQGDGGLQVEQVGGALEKTRLDRVAVAQQAVAGALQGVPAHGLAVAAEQLAQGAALGLVLDRWGARMHSTRTNRLRWEQALGRESGNCKLLGHCIWGFRRLAIENQRLAAQNTPNSAKIAPRLANLG